MDQSSHPRSRAVLAACFAAALLTLEPWSARAQPIALPASPLCAGAAHPTPRQTAGPFYKPNAPRRHELAGNEARGERIVITGYVLTRGCKPVAQARLDVWQADAAGAYDNRGFNLRGQESTDDEGRYWFTTIVPGEYPGRTPHVHVKITAPGRRTVTTQLYFPNARHNARDEIFNPRLLITLEKASGGDAAQVGRFDFVLDMP